MIHLRPLFERLDEYARAREVQITRAPSGRLVRRTLIVSVFVGQVAQCVDDAHLIVRGVDQRAVIRAEPDVFDFVLQRRAALLFEIVGQQRAGLLVVFPRVALGLDAAHREAREERTPLGRDDRAEVALLDREAQNAPADALEIDRDADGLLVLAALLFVVLFAVFVNRRGLGNEW